MATSTQRQRNKDGFIIRCVRYKSDPPCPGTALMKHGDLEIEPKNSHEGHGSMTEEQDVVLFFRRIEEGCPRQ